MIDKFAHRRQTCVDPSNTCDFTVENGVNIGDAWTGISDSYLQEFIVHLLAQFETDFTAACVQESIASDLRNGCNKSCLIWRAQSDNDRELLGRAANEEQLALISKLTFGNLPTFCCHWLPLLDSGILPHCPFLYPQRIY